MRAKFSWPSTGRRIGPSTTRPVLQAEPANLAGRDVNVFGRGEVVVGHAAQEAVAVGQHFERAGAAHDLAALDLPADDADDELAAAHAGVLGDAFALGQVEELGHGQAGTGRRGGSFADAAGGVELAGGAWRWLPLRLAGRPAVCVAFVGGSQLPAPSSLRATAMVDPPTR